jgi:hypothetical protein
LTRIFAISLGINAADVWACISDSGGESPMGWNFDQPKMVHRMVFFQDRKDQFIFESSPTLG